MRMIQEMCGYMIKEKVGIAPIEDKMREIKLRWFEHVKIRRCKTINLTHCRRGRRQSKTSWKEVIRCDLNFMGLMEHMTQDRSL